MNNLDEKIKAYEEAKEICKNYKNYTGGKRSANIKRLKIAIWVRDSFDTTNIY